LHLDKILDAQYPRSAELEPKPAHDEMLFIIVHQIYELWFKQIIHELSSVIEMFQKNEMDERKTSVAVARLERITEIQELIIKQIDVMETMTPLDFLDFRHYLFPASGFQSFQFRVLEIMIGLREKERLSYNKASFHVVFDEERREFLRNLEADKSLLEVIEDWLERIPFLDFGDFNFLEEYKIAVKRMLQKETKSIMSSTILLEETKKLRLRMLGDTNTYFDSVLNPDKHKEYIESGQLKLSYKATIAALFIHLYRDEPILQLPYQLLAKIMHMEELFTAWRSRHAQMVLRMIGRKTGTGGSSGHEYLRNTAQKHQIFSDLFNISTLLIPRSELPQLPEDLRQKLGFHYTSSTN
jgi:tryptophan 2,3-dioxygenase